MPAKINRNGRLGARRPSQITGRSAGKNICNDLILKGSVVLEPESKSPVTDYFYLINLNAPKVLPAVLPAFFNF